MTTYSEYAESLRIGTVDFVSPNEIKVVLDIEAPDSISLNTGTPRPFPRVNGYVLIPSDDGYLVGQVEWITIEKSPHPQRRGFKDFGLIDLPYPLRKMSLNPVGTLRSIASGANGQARYEFKRGSESFPTVGDSVLLPTTLQLRDVVESGEKRAVKIGTSVLAANADVTIDPNKLFGRHCAVLGNTGSGKSCTVAGLIRWSLEAAYGSALSDTTNILNARFIILDPNGEYSRAFENETGPLKPKIFRVGDTGLQPTAQLHVPLWLWNSAEWCAFTQASEKSQRPLVKRVLREIKSAYQVNTTHDPRFKLRQKISSICIKIRDELRSGNSYEGWRLGPKLDVMYRDMQAFHMMPEFATYAGWFNYVLPYFQTVLNKPNQTYTNRTTGAIGYNPFQSTDIEGLIAPLEQFLNALGGIVYHQGPHEDTPIEFDGSLFVSHLEETASQESSPQYHDSLLIRTRSLLSDARMRGIIDRRAGTTLDQWLNDYIGSPAAQEGNITIIDLSLVPSEIIHLLTSVISRMVFEALQRYRRLSPSHNVLPTVLVMEEAHTFVRRYRDDVENNDIATVCCQVFERIAREGRKFGLGLVISSQRPSELSPTVLSQCNTFLLHRISNDRDQELVHRFLPDNLKGLLRDLPTLSSQNAILLGWAAELPVLVRINDLPKSQQPLSDDPKFWEVWTGAEAPDLDSWAEIVNDWQNTGSNTDADDVRDDTLEE